MQHFEVEFLDVGPAQPAPVEHLSTGPRAPRRWLTWLVAGSAVCAALVAAVVVTSREGGAAPASPTPSVTAPTAVPNDVGLPAPLPSWSPVADAPSVVYLGGCTACAHFPRLSPKAVRAIRSAFPGAKIEGAASVVSSETGRLFTERALIRVGRTIVVVKVDAGTGTFPTSVTLTDDKITVQVGVDGFLVVLHSTGGRVLLADLVRLAEDPRLVAA